MDFMTAVKTCFSKYVDFKGRAARSEFWWWVLFGIVSSIILGLIPFIGMIWSLALILPNLAVTARRLHDTDRSGWWMLAPYGVGFLSGAMAFTGSGALVTIVGILAFVMFVVLIIWLATKGSDGDNRFGSDPLAAAVAVDPTAKFKEG